MEINRGSLDDISRPASSERAGSRVSSVSLSQIVRKCPSSPTRLVVLANGNTVSQDEESSTENTTTLSESPDGDHCSAKVTDEEDTNSKLQKAIDEMKRLDAILAALNCKEKHIKSQWKEIKEQLWGELMRAPKNVSECVSAAENTRLFLTLEAPNGTEEETKFEPVFGTQPPDENEIHIEHEEQSINNLRSTINASEGGRGETEREQSEQSHCEAPRGKKKQDFVKKNIELAGAGGGVLMTPAEKERLAVLLKEMEEEDGEEDYAARGSDSEGDAWVLSVPTGHGYNPEQSDLDQLRDIDSRLSLLLPVEDFFSVRSSFVNCSMSQGNSTDIGCELSEEPLTRSEGPAAGCEMVDREEEEGSSPRDPMADGDVGPMRSEMTQNILMLTEDQLRSLLEECELTQSYSVRPDPGASSPCGPHLSEALLTALLQDPYTTTGLDRPGPGDL